MTNNDQVITFCTNFISITYPSRFKSRKIRRKEGNGKRKRNRLIIFISKLIWECLHVKLLWGLLRKSKKMSDGHLIENFAILKEPVNAKT